MKKILVIGENAERIHSNGGGSAETVQAYCLTENEEPDLKDISVILR
ncbi:hypothetical protein AALB47_03335 [Lachnospiraceae bacterium 54-11]